MGGEAFKRRLVHGVALTIMAWKTLYLLLKSFIGNELKCKAHLKTKFNCVCITKCSLVMSPFSRDYMKTEIDQLKYQQCFNWFTCVQNLHSAWFLDGRTSFLIKIGQLQRNWSYNIWHIHHHVVNHVGSRAAICCLPIIAPLSAWLPKFSSYWLMIWLKSS